MLTCCPSLTMSRIGVVTGSATIAAYSWHPRRRSSPVGGACATHVWRRTSRMNVSAPFLENVVTKRMLCVCVFFIDETTTSTSSTGDDEGVGEHRGLQSASSSSPLDTLVTGWRACAGFVAGCHRGCAELWATNSRDAVSMVGSVMFVGLLFLTPAYKIAVRLCARLLFYIVFVYLFSAYIFLSSDHVNYFLKICYRKHGHVPNSSVFFCSLDLVKLQCSYAEWAIRLRCGTCLLFLYCFRLSRFFPIVFYFFLII